MSDIILIRHGENNWVKKHRLAGWIPNVSLNKTGMKQAVDAGQRVASLPIAAIYSSPLERCLQTAEQIAKPHKLPIKTIPEIGEVKYGEWEGKKISKLAQKAEWHTIQHFPSRFTFPGGESLLEAQHRMVQAIEQIVLKHPDQTIAIVSHADLIKLALAHYMGVHIDLFQRIVISPASLSMIRLNQSGSVQIVRLNDTGPLTTPKKKKKKK